MNEKEEFRRALLVLRLEQVSYIAEHKEPSLEVTNQMKTLRKDFSRKIVKKEWSDKKW